MAERGPRGDHGQHGDEGRVGPIGETGDTGDVGERGPFGERGPAGDRGQVGDTGATGETGAPGESTVLSRHITGSFLVLTVVFALILAGLAWVITENRELAREGKEAHSVLCGLGTNIVERIERSERYLADVESGKREPIVGITIREIQESVNRDHDSIEQFKALDCVPAIEHHIEGGRP